MLSQIEADSLINMEKRLAKPSGLINPMCEFFDLFKKGLKVQAIAPLMGFVNTPLEESDGPGQLYHNRFLPGR